MTISSESQRTTFTDFILRTTLNITPSSEDLRGKIIDALDRAIYENSRTYPLVEKYFVQAATARHEIEVGFLIKKVSSSNVHNIATGLLKDSLDEVSQKLALTVSPLIEETALSLA